MASPRVCCAGPELGNRETAEDVDGRMRVEREDTALGEGACRESILMCCCAQLRRRGVAVGFIAEGSLESSHHGLERL